MSGGSSTPSYGGGDGVSDSSSDCEIVERVPLNSPQSAVVTHLRVGLVLDVVLLKGPPQSLVAQIPNAGQVAGSLTPKSLVRLLRCIREGNVYVADVLAIKGGFVEVEIRRQ
jgi:hypothetical protein